MKVSVVVPTYRRLDLLRRCLEALLDQDLDPQAYEIIVADDAASQEVLSLIDSLMIPVEFSAVAENVAEQVNAYGATRVATQPALKFALRAHAPLVRYLPVRGAHGPAAARNAGWRAAMGEVIAFTDDDCIPDQHWLSGGLAAMASGVDGVSGRVIVPLPEHPSDYEREQLGLERSEFITANCFYRKSVLQALGGFDERYPMAWREDSDLYFGALEQGYRLNFSPEPVVIHPIRPAPWGVSIGQQKKTMFNALCYKKHPKHYRQTFRLRAPLVYYMMFASLLLGLVALIGQWWYLAAGSLAANLGMILFFAYQRLRDTSRHPLHVIEMVVTSAVIPYLSLYWRFRGALRYRVWYF